MNLLNSTIQPIRSTFDDNHLDIFYETLRLMRLFDSDRIITSNVYNYLPKVYKTEQLLENDLLQDLETFCSKNHCLFEDKKINYPSEIILSNEFEVFNTIKLKTIDHFCKEFNIEKNDCHLSPTKGMSVIKCGSTLPMIPNYFNSLQSDSILIKCIYLIKSNTPDNCDTIIKNNYKYNIYEGCVIYVNSDIDSYSFCPSVNNAYYLVVSLYINREIFYKNCYYFKDKQSIHVTNGRLRNKLDVHDMCHQSFLNYYLMHITIKHQEHNLIENTKSVISQYAKDMDVLFNILISNNEVYSENYFQSISFNNIPLDYMPPSFEPIKNILCENGKTKSYLIHLIYSMPNGNYLHHPFIKKYIKCGIFLLKGLQLYATVDDSVYSIVEQDYLLCKNSIISFGYNETSMPFLIALIEYE